MRKVGQAALGLLFLGACTQHGNDTTPTIENQSIPPEIQTELEQLFEIVPSLFANATLTAAAQLEFDGLGDLADGEAIVRVDNLDCSIAEDISEAMKENPAQYEQYQGRIEAFLNSLSENNAAIIRDITENGIRYSFEVNCDTVPAYNLIN